MDWIGLSLLLAGMVSVLVGRQVLTAGAARTSADAASALRDKYAALRKWTYLALLMLLLPLKSAPLLQAGALILVVAAAEGWTYRTAQILAIPAHYRHGIALSSALAVTAICAYFTVLLIRQIAAA